MLLLKCELNNYYSLLKLFLEKYYLFDFNFSDEKMDGLKEELLKYIKKEWMRYLNSYFLSLFSLTFSVDEELKRVGNKIINKGSFIRRNCIFDYEMKKVYL